MTPAILSFARCRLSLGRDAVFYVFDKTSNGLNALLRGSRSLMEHGGRDAFDTRHRRLLPGRPRPGPLGAGFPCSGSGGDLRRALSFWTRRRLGGALGPRRALRCRRGLSTRLLA